MVQRFFALGDFASWGEERRLRFCTVFSFGWDGILGFPTREVTFMDVWTIEGEMKWKWICTLVGRCPYSGESMRMNQMIYLRAAFVHVNSGTVGKVAASNIYFPKVFGSPQ
jgi:hypothetical protein